MSGVVSTKPVPSLEGLAELARLSTDGSSEAIDRILSLARAALDMDVALVGAFDGDFVIEAIDGDSEWFDLEVGSRIPADQTYCGRMARGKLPHLIHDAAADERTADLPITREAGIGAYVGAPIRLWDGTLYGTLCCLSRSAEPSLNDRDVRFLRVLAEIVADQLDREGLESEKRKLEWSRIRSILDRDQVDIEFQPIFDLLDCRIVSLEALARFWTEPMRGPAVWFAEANEVGLGVELELAAMRAALLRLDDFPPEVAIALNVSPATALDPRFCELLLDVAGRVVIEITEHAQVDDYDALREALAPLRERGAQLAIDDVGAGFANLRHILRLAPDLVKLDLSLTHEIAQDPAREALARFLTEPMRGPAVWFAEANEVGLGVELELAAMRAALLRLDEFPPGVSIALNVSPATALDPRFSELLLGVAGRVVIEITEHAQVDDYDALCDALAPLRERGAQLAIDDVGAGFANLRHILRLAPDLVKLDLSLTQEIARDPAREALASSLVGFAEGVGASIVAEGISSDEDLALLRMLGVDYGQGFHLARPSALLN